LEKKIFHKIYEKLGILLCKTQLCFWRIRDKVSPPKADSLLLVAHPDDEALFFHTYIKEKRPYVAVMTTGWSYRRVRQFYSAMKAYGCRYRAYPLDSATLWAEDSPGLEVLARQVRECLGLKNFTECATHGKTGEYGHKVHQRVHSAVTENAKCKVLTVADKNTVLGHPLSSAQLEEKKTVFHKLYKTEDWCVEQYAVWMEHEQLEEYNP